jgi:hypothetical protein
MLMRPVAPAVVCPVQVVTLLPKVPAEGAHVTTTVVGSFNRGIIST